MATIEVLAIIWLFDTTPRGTNSVVQAMFHKSISQSVVFVSAPNSLLVELVVLSLFFPRLHGVWELQGVCHVPEDCGSKALKRKLFFLEEVSKHKSQEP